MNIDGYYIGKSIKMNINSIIKWVNEYHKLIIALDSGNNITYNPFYYRENNKLYECYGDKFFFSDGNFILVTREQVLQILNGENYFCKHYDKLNKKWIIK